MIKKDTEIANSSRAGGAAMAGGQRFQAQVTAWWCARILLQTPGVGKPFDLPAVSIVERVYCETMDSIDDIRVELTGNGRILGQCKRSLRLSSKPGSIWASVLIQFYNELERVPPTGAEKRLVLFYEKYNNNLTGLSAVLDRYRQLPVGTSLIDAATNAKERKLVNNLNALIDALEAKPEFQSLATRREELFRHVYIKQLRLSPGEADYLGVADALRDGLLTNPAQTNQVLTLLHRIADDLLADRGSMDRLALRRRVKGEGIILRDSPDYRNDFKQLEDWSATEIEIHEAEGRSRLAIAEHQVSVSRPVVQAMLKAAQTTSFLVVGGAGTGKTGCLLALAKQLHASGRRVWYWAADSLSYPSLHEIGNQLKLQYPWKDLFAEATSGVGAILIIDGLDGLRDTHAQRAYRDLIALAIHCGIRVIASIRSFDLQYAVDLQEMFASAGLPAPQFSDDAFKKVSHVVVPELDDEELDQVVDQLPVVQTVLNAAPRLRLVARNLFSLDLLCKLISDGDSAVQLSAISTQAELFERYWAKRIDSHELRDEMTGVLKRLIEQMVDQQALQVVPDGWSRQVKDALFSAELIRHPPSAPDRLPEQELVEFNHHLLFDYAAELLFVRPRRNRLAVELASPDTWGLFLRPSLVLFHRYAWHHGRLDFWDTLVELERSSVPILQKLPGHLVVAEEAYRREDLHPLLKGCLQDGGDEVHWASIVQGVVAAATFSSLPRLFNRASGDWWIEFARDLIHTGNSQLVYAGRRLLFSASDALKNLSTQARLFLNQAAVALVKFHWGEEAQPSPLIRPAIEWVCRTIGSDLLASSEIIRKILTRDELQRAGYIQAYEVAHHIEDIWQADPSLAIEVYDAVFGYVETDRSATPIGGSLILSMVSNRAQDYKMAHYALSEQFPAFLHAHPREATCALIRVIRHYRNQGHLRGELSPIETFTWDGRECRLQPDYSYIWDGDRQYPDDQTKMLHTWEDYLVTLPTDGQADGKWEAISDVVATDSELSVVWRRFLIAASRSPAFYAQRLWTMLLNVAILIGPDTQEAAEDCIEAFMPHLPDKAVRQIESTILGITRRYFAGADTDAIERYLPTVKARLLCCVPEERRGIAAKEFLAGCDPELLQPRHREPAEKSPAWEWEDVDVARHQHQELLEISAFLEKLSTSDVTDDTSTEVFQKIRRVEEVLAESQDEIDGRLVSTVQKRLIRGFAQVACSQATLDEQLIKELFERFRKVLALPVEASSLQHLEQFDHSPWGSLDPRANAAEGFVCLAVKPKGFTVEYKRLLHQLAADPDPVVRFHLGRRIWSFLDKWPEFVWETVERWVGELPTRAGTLGVIKGTLRDSWFWWLRNNDSIRADQLLRNLLAAARLRNSTELRRACGMWLAALSFFEGEVWASEAISSAIGSIKDSLDELGGAQRVALDELLPRTQKRPGSVEQRHRAKGFLLRLLSAADQALKAYEMEIANQSPSDRPSELPQWVKQVAEFFNSTARQFSFSAKEQSKQWGVVQHDERKEQVTAWWETVEPILDALLAMPHPRIAYDLINGLEHLVDLDVQRSLHWLRRVTLASVPAGLATESLAADHTMGILERILAEHKVSLAVGSALRSNFIKILEAYLQVGWPRAMRLAIHLESIFR